MSERDVWAELTQGMGAAIMVGLSGWLLIMGIWLIFSLLQRRKP